MTPQVDVLIVGGGPVGMLLATELGLQDVDTLVVERNRVTQDEPRAGTLHARTVQSLARRGFVHIVADHEPHALAAEQFHFAGMPGLVITGPANEGPPILGQTQADLERLFERRARQLGVEIRRGHEVQRVEHDHDKAVAVIVGDRDSYRVEARFIVGADGARSAVRETGGFVSATHPATISALLGLVRLEDPAGTPRGWHRTERGWLVINNNPFGHSRVITFDFSGPHRDRHAPLTLDELHAQTSRIAGHDIPMSDARFLSRFSNFSRLVKHYKIGRILLAGDAAHVHFPVGGQGLNLGLQDALNLGWKLAAAVGGAETLLDTYHPERHPAAQRVIDNTRAQAALMNPDPQLDPLRDLFTELIRIDDVSSYLGDMISAQEVRYPRDGGSPHAGEFLPNVSLHTKQGSRSIADLLAEGRPVLILLDEADERLARTARPWAERVSIVHASCVHQVPWRAVLLRPDGYLAWDESSISGDVEGLHAALAKWFPRLTEQPSAGSPGPSN